MDGGDVRGWLGSWVFMPRLVVYIYENYEDEHINFISSYACRSLDTDGW